MLPAGGRMTLRRFGSGSGAHALVVGVGEYPWLLGGSELPTFTDHEGMGQLTAAPLSALAFAKWLSKEYRSGTCPLRSIELLVSSADPALTDPAFPPPYTRATFAEFRRAVIEWHRRLKAGDRAIFFFSGHGMGTGFQHTLVLEDYGSDPATAMGYAFDFTRFQVAMARADPMEQCFFLDACRMSSGFLMGTLGTYGDPILTPQGALPSPARGQAVLYATMPGDSAYGRPGQTSLFTEALLRAMRGSGAARRGSGWVIGTRALADGLQVHLDELARPYGTTQNCMPGTLASFDLHELTGLPEVPVTVACRGSIDPGATTISVTGPQGNRDQPPPVPQPWRFELPAGVYQFVAQPPGGVPRSEIVFPPITPVELP